MLYTKLIKKYRNGDVDGCVKLYGEFTELICDFICEETPVHLWNCTLENSAQYMDKVNNFYGRTK